MESWLNTIYMFVHDQNNDEEVDKPQVVVVFTHADKINLNPDEASDRLEELTDNIRTYFKDKPTNGLLDRTTFLLDNNAGPDDVELEFLRKHIFEMARKQKSWGEMVPTRWLKLELELQKEKRLGKKVLSVDEVRNINSKLDVQIKDSQELDVFLRFLHDTGDILFFREDILKNWLVLDPSWLVDAFKTIVTSKEFANRNPKTRDIWRKLEKSCVISRGEIEILWKEDDEKSFFQNKNLLLRFLHRLHYLANTTPPSQWDSKYLVPCMLTQDKQSLHSPPPVFARCKTTNILCLYPTKKILPATIFHKLQAVCIEKWPVAKSGDVNDEKEQMYCGLTIFKLDERQENLLTVFLANFAVHAFITNVTDNEVSIDLCHSVLEFLSSSMTKIISDAFGNRQKIQTCTKCPMTDSADNDVYFTQEYLNDKRRNGVSPIQCPYNCKSHRSHRIDLHALLNDWFAIKDDSQDNDLKNSSVHDSKTVVGSDSLSKISSISKRTAEQNGYTLARTIIDSSKDSNAVRKVAGGIMKQLNHIYKDSCEHVKFGYTDDGHPVFVVLLKGDEAEKQPRFEYPLSTFDIRTRGTDFIRSEAEHVNKVPLDMNKTHMSKVRKCLKQYSKQLFESHSNLTSISMSPVRSQGYPDSWCWTRETCVVLHVSLKGVIPFSEGALPKVLDGVGIDVREDICIPLNGPDSAADEYHQRLRIGCKIGDGNVHGTIGGFVQLENGIIGCITASHVFLKDGDIDKRTVKIKKKKIPLISVRQNFGENISVYQPGRKVDGPFGLVTNAVFRRGEEGKKGVDAAFVQITDRKRKPTVGFPKSTGNEALCQRFRFTSGRIVKNFESIDKHFHTSEVFKFGCTTGPTVGKYVGKGGSCQIKVHQNHELDLHNMIVVVNCDCDGNTSDGLPAKSLLTAQLTPAAAKYNPTETKLPFAKEGDSGSLVLIHRNTDETYALGIISTATKAGQVFITPINRVLKAFECDVERGLLHFKDNVPSDDEDLTEKRLKKVEEDIVGLREHTQGMNKKIAHIDKIEQNVAEIPAIHDKLNNIVDTLAALKSDAKGPDDNNTSAKIDLK